MDIAVCGGSAIVLTLDHRHAPRLQSRLWQGTIRRIGFRRKPALAWKNRSARDREQMRPRTLHEVARRRTTSEDSFDRALREFLDAFYLAPADERAAFIAAEPPRLSPRHDAYLAAVAEHLARRFGLAIPEWTEHGDRFLHEPFFAGGLESLKATLLVESPAAFRRRLLFVSADALSRPRERRSA